MFVSLPPSGQKQLLQDWDIGNYCLCIIRNAQPAQVLNILKWYPALVITLYFKTVRMRCSDGRQADDEQNQFYSAINHWNN